MLRSFPEIVTETTEDSSNPFVTSVILDGIVVAKGGFTNKKMSRQVAARLALSTMCPLLTIEDDQWLGGAAEPGVGVVDLGNGVVGANAATVARLEQQEAATLRLRLSDDRILHNTVGKTPVMVLQEHCHKHEGQTPTYSTVMNRSTTASRGHSSHVITVVCGSGGSSQSVTEQSDKKKEAKQRAALTMLRRLRLHVETPPYSGG